MKTVSEEPNAVVWDCGYWVKHDAPECYANETHNLRRQLAQARARIRELEAEVERLRLKARIAELKREFKRTEEETGMSEQERGSFVTELTALINRYSIENESDTPDHILAEYLKGCLGQFAVTLKARDKWYGFEPWHRPQVKDVGEELGIEAIEKAREEVEG